MADVTSEFDAPGGSLNHGHVFLAPGHAQAERRTWAVIWLCGAMMVVEITGGLLFNSVALVADGMHMSTHAGAMLLAALAYSYARRHADDPRFSFGTGKLGDLAGFTSAVVLAMIALLIGYEAVARLLAPVPIHFGEAIPIAALGLVVNLGSVWLLSGGGHDHGHAHHGHGHTSRTHGLPAEMHHAVFEEDGHAHHGGSLTVAARDNNMRAAIVHVIADAMVSVLVIVGLVLARAFGWVWMDPLAGLLGAGVIVSWSLGLVRDTGAILLDMSPDQMMVESMRSTIEADGDLLRDLHLWRLGPGHLGAIVAVVTSQARGPEYYRGLLGRFSQLSHVTVEVCARGEKEAVLF